MSEHFDIDAEEAVLGLCLMHPKAIDHCIARGLAPPHFWTLANAEVYRIILRRYDAQVAIDAHLVQAELKDVRPGYCDELIGGYYVDAAKIHAYAARIVELALWRHREHEAYAMQVACEAMDEAAFARCEHDLARAIRPDEHTYTPAQLADEVSVMLEGGEVTFAFPFMRMNELTSGGMRRGEVTLLGGWTSHGKSVLLDQILERGVADGHNVHLFINEMTPRQRTARFIARKAGVLLGDLMQNRLSSSQMVKVAAALNTVPYSITDVAGWSALQISRSMRRRRADIVGIDILHLIEHRDERDIAGISAELNRAAKLADCHIVATVHLNENRVMGQTRPMPTMGDIRGSGMLKNDADNVLFVFREQDADTGYPQHEATVYFAKVRSGTPGGVAATFDGARMQFHERDSWRTVA